MSNAAQYLQHGKALCGKVFGAFVETFNWHTDFCRNIKGDYDIGKSNKGISVDRKDPHHPIIRFVDDSVESEGDDSLRQDRSCFRLESRSVQADEYHRHLVNCYYRVGGIMRHDDDSDVENLIPNAMHEAEDDTVISTFLCYSFNLPLGEHNGTPVACLTEELGTIQNDPKRYVVPLYVFDQYGNLLADLRNAPGVQLVETIGV